jgi:general stress protein 26
MKKVSLKKIADKMKNLDICMMTTQDGRNVYHSRPMSNNGKVEYDGNSYFFTYMKSTKVKRKQEKELKQAWVMLRLLKWK